MPESAVAVAAPPPLTPSRGLKPVNRPSSHTGEELAFGVGAGGLAALLAWLLWPRSPTSPSSCPPGQYLPTGASGCVQCPSGTVRSSGMPISQCVSCPSGQQPLSDQSGCAPIPVLTPICPPAGSIIEDALSGALYAVDQGGVMHYIASTAALAACGYCDDPSHVTQVSDATMQGLLASCAQGADIDGQSTCVLGPALCPVTPQPPATPVGACGTDPDNDLSVTPYWWSQASQATQIASTVVAMLLGRWDCTEPTDQHWTSIYNAPCCGYTPLQMVAFRIVSDSGQELVSDVQRLANQYQAGGAFAGSPNPAEDCFIAAAFNIVFNRNWAGAPASLLDTWRSFYETPWTEPSGETLSGPERLVWQFCMQPEFSDRVQYNIGNPISCSPGVSGCNDYEPAGMVASAALAVSAPGIL